MKTMEKSEKLRLLSKGMTLYLYETGTENAFKFKYVNDKLRATLKCHDGEEVEIDPENESAELALNEGLLIPGSRYYKFPYSFYVGLDTAKGDEIIFYRKRDDDFGEIVSARIEGRHLRLKQRIWGRKVEDEFGDFAPHFIPTYWKLTEVAEALNVREDKVLETLKTRFGYDYADAGIFHYLTGAGLEFVSANSLPCEKVFNEARCYLNDFEDVAIRIGTDGSWTFRRDNGDEAHYSKEDVTKRKFRNYLYHGNVIENWDDEDHELIMDMRRNQISEEEFETYGVTWKLNPVNQNERIYV